MAPEKFFFPPQPGLRILGNTTSHRFPGNPGANGSVRKNNLARFSSPGKFWAWGFEWVFPYSVTYSTPMVAMIMDGLDVSYAETIAMNGTTICQVGYIEDAVASRRRLPADWH